MRLECDLVFRDGWAKCRRCKKKFPAPHGRARSHCAIEPPLPTHGPGSWLKWLLSWFRIVATHGCKCNKMAKKMNEQGGLWCLRSGRAEIVSTMAAEAEKRKLRFSPWKGDVLICLAVMLWFLEWLLFQEKKHAGDSRDSGSVRRPVRGTDAGVAGSGDRERHQQRDPIPGGPRPQDAGASVPGSDRPGQ